MAEVMGLCSLSQALSSSRYPTDSRIGLTSCRADSNVWVDLVLSKHEFHRSRETVMRFLALLALCSIGAALAEEIPRPVGDTSIVDPEAKFEMLYTRSAPVSGGLTEGPAVAPDGSIYFS